MRFNEVNKMSSDIWKTYLHYYKIYIVNINNVHVSHQHHASARVLSTWQGHVAPSATSHPRVHARHIPPFCDFFNYFKYLKIENKLKQNQKNSRKIYKIGKIITFKMQLQIKSNLFCWIQNLIIYHYKRSNY